MECLTPHRDAPVANTAPGNPPVGPVTCSETRNIRVNVHFVQRNDGTGNFNENNDGRPSSSTNFSGFQYADYLIQACNSNSWDNNPTLTIPPGSQLTPRAKRIHLVLDGVYFDRNSSLHDFNSGGVPLFRPLLKDQSTVINIFLCEVPLISNQQDPRYGFPSYRPSFGGYAPQATDCSYSANEFFTVIRGAWSLYTDTGAQPWQLASTVNHEIGHLLGLNHTYEINSATGLSLSDCADTPAHANCWNLNEPATASCDQPSEVSNNLMDYNAGQIALSPCQLDKINAVLSNCAYNYVASCGSCLPSVIRFSLPSRVCSDQAIVLDGRASFNDIYFTISIDRLDAAGQPIAAYHFEQTYWRQLDVEQLQTLYSFAGGQRYQVSVVGGSCSAATASQIMEVMQAPCTTTAPRVSINTIHPVTAIKP